jgi:hypothetical protein
LRALEGLAALPHADYVEWAGTVASVARRFEEAHHPEDAETIRWGWWQQLGEKNWKVLPAAAVEMFGTLKLADRRTLTRRWMGRLEALGDRPGEDSLVAAIGEAVAGDRELTFAYDLARLARQVKAGRMELAEAAARGELMAWRAGKVQDRRQEVLRRLLSPLEVERMRAVLGLLLSPWLWQTTKETLEEHELPKLPRIISNSLLSDLPSVGELASRPLALLAVAEYVGSRWQANPSRARELLRESLAGGHLPYAVRFLRRSEQSRSRSFVRQLEWDRDRDLLRKLQRAARSPTGVELARYVSLEEPRPEARA